MTEVGLALINNVFYILVLAIVSFTILAGITLWKESK
jgi:hypothetical protein